MRKKRIRVDEGNWREREQEKDRENHIISYMTPTSYCKFFLA